MSWPDVCPACGAAWKLRSKTMGAAAGQPHEGRCANDHWWSEAPAHENEVTSPVDEVLCHELLDQVFEPSGPLVDRIRTVVEVLRATRIERNQWAALGADLDRCEHGRHEGDVCADCHGPSKGNPLWGVGRVAGVAPVDEAYDRLWARFGESENWPDRLVGFSLGGVPLCVPPRPAAGGGAPHPRELLPAMIDK